MFLFDPRAGTGAFIMRLSAVTFNTADIAADAGNDALADAMWQLGAMLSHGAR